MHYPIERLLVQLCLVQITFSRAMDSGVSTLDFIFTPNKLLTEAEHDYEYTDTNETTESSNGPILMVLVIISIFIITAVLFVFCFWNKKSDPIESTRKKIEIKCEQQQTVNNSEKTSQILSKHEEKSLRTESIKNPLPASNVSFESISVISKSNDPQTSSISIEENQQSKVEKSKTNQNTKILLANLSNQQQNINVMKVSESRSNTEESQNNQKEIKFQKNFK